MISPNKEQTETMSADQLRVELDRLYGSRIVLDSDQKPQLAELERRWKNSYSTVQNGLLHRLIWKTRHAVSHRIDSYETKKAHRPGGYSIPGWLDWLQKRVEEKPVDLATRKLDNCGHFPENGPPEIQPGIMALDMGPEYTVRRFFISPVSGTHWMGYSNVATPFVDGIPKSKPPYK